VNLAERSVYRSPIPRSFGMREHYDPEGMATREERFLVPYQREEDVLG
jgi:hypothetical protein